MSKPDDNTLDPADLAVIEERAKRLLNNADAWNRFPVPIDDLLAAANVKLASHSVFNAENLMAYLAGKASNAAANIKSAISKILGLYDAKENLIHVDETVIKSRQTFLKLHETGHHDIPTHKKTFRFFQDCEKTLAPEIADRFEREANNFARFVLFKGPNYSAMAADFSLSLKTPISLAKKFGASLYASAREYARTNPRACAVYVLEPEEYIIGKGYQATVRRTEVSQLFKHQFGVLSDLVIGPDHHLAAILPIGRKVTRPTSITLTDRNGVSHDCVAEAFHTTFNIIILVYPVQALTKTTVIFPGAVPF